MSGTKFHRATENMVRVESGELFVVKLSREQETSQLLRRLLIRVLKTLGHHSGRQKDARREMRKWRPRE